MKQVRELHDILTELHDEEMVLSGIFHVVVIVKKLPFLWREFKTYLKHKRKKMSIN